jgi:hypothetical protein
MVRKNPEDTKAYQAAYIRQHYANNKQYYIERAAARRKEMSEWLQDYKATHPCVDCGESDPACIQFHHRNPAEKEFNLADAVRRGWSINKILREIAKCDIVCANCHLKRHRDARLV